MKQFEWIWKFSELKATVGFSSLLSEIQFSGSGLFLILLRTFKKTMYFKITVKKLRPYIIIIISGISEEVTQLYLQQKQSTEQRRADLKRIRHGTALEGRKTL